MGSLMSLPARKRRIDDHELCQIEACKRMKMSDGFNDENPRLITSLPDEISYQILARVPRICYMKLKLVSRAWRTAITSHEIYELRRELGTTEEWLYILEKVKDDTLLWHALDPISRRWERLPPMPTLVHEEHKNSKKGLSELLIWNIVGSTAKIADVIKGWFGQKVSLDRLPFCGCAVGAADGCLYVLGGFFRASAMQCVWRYDPCVNAWSEVTSMKIGRAYCKTGLLGGKLYVVGGVSRSQGGLTPLQSAEVFDPSSGLWTSLPSMPFAKAQGLPTAFLADMLKPIATGMTIYRGKLCVPQSLYSWPFFVDIGGEIYDPETESWVEMPSGMGEGWPAKQAGTKLSVIVDDELYTLDPSSSLDSGKIKLYNPQQDSWEVVIAKVPIRDFTDTESPYLLAGLHGKLHVITKQARNFTTVLQANLQKASSSSVSSISSPPENLEVDNLDFLTDEERDVWTVVASKNFGTAELVSCQVLDI